MRGLANPIQREGINAGECRKGHQAAREVPMLHARPDDNRTDDGDRYNPADCDNLSRRTCYGGCLVRRDPHHEHATTLLAGEYNTLPLDINASMTQRIRPTLFALGTASTLFSLLMIGLFLLVYTILARRTR